MHSPQLPRIVAVSVHLRLDRAETAAMHSAKDETDAGIESLLDDRAHASFVPRRRRPFGLRRFRLSDRSADS